VVTRTGDSGTTGMADGSRCSKNAPRVHCLGEIDELNAHLGVVLGLLDEGQLKSLLFGIQHDLFDIGAELCQPGKALIGDRHVDALEDGVAALNAELAPLKEFILPGGSPAVAALQLARAVCRRAERAVVGLAEVAEVNPMTRQYVNRLSDLLFIVARSQAKREGNPEIYWNSEFSRLARDDS
jgi:cob(I)alamin adenosyltransferase